MTSPLQAAVEVRALAKKIAELERRLAGAERAAQADRTSLENGSISVYDAEGMLRGTVGVQSDGTVGTSAVNAPPPPVPTDPVVVGVLGGLQVTWDGLWVGGAGAPLDLARIEVHVGLVAAFFPSELTLMGTIETVFGGTVAVPADSNATRFVLLLARNTSGVAGGLTATVSTAPKSVVTTDLGFVLEAGGVKATMSNIAPPNPRVDDLWIDSSAGNTVKQWSGTVWVSAYLGASALSATARELGGITTYTQATAPIKRGAAPSPSTGGFGTEAFGTGPFGGGSGGGATTAAAGFGTEPFGTGPFGTGTSGAAVVVVGEDLQVGDIWYKSDAGNREHRWSGTAWVPVLIGAAAIAADTIVAGSAIIGKAAIGDAQIGNMAVDKLIAGKLTATFVELLGRLTTAPGGVMSGARVELDSQGIRAYLPSSTGPDSGRVLTIGADGQIRIVNASLINGDEAGTHTELSSVGLRVFAASIIDGTPNEVIRLGTGTDDFIGVSNATGNLVASITQDGQVNASGLSVATEPEFMGELFTTYLNKAGRGVIAWGVRTSAGVATSTTEAPYLELQGDFFSDRSYRIKVTGLGLANDTAGGKSIVRLRVSFDTTQVSVISSQAVGRRYIQDIPGLGEAVGDLEYWIQGTGSEQPTREVRFLLSYVAESGITQIVPQSAVYLYIEDMGPVVDDISIDKTLTPATTSTKKRYVKTYYSTGSGTYRADGSRRSDTNDVVQGRVDAFNGTQKGLWVFPSMTADLAGSVVTKVEVYAYASHWYSNAGGTARIHTHAQTSVPASAPVLDFRVASPASASGPLWPKPGDRWVTLPGPTYDGFRTGAIRGFGMGPASSTSLAQYGRFRGTDARIRVTYLK